MPATSASDNATAIASPYNHARVNTNHARRTPDGHWPESLSPDEIRSALHDNLEHLGVDAMDVVNLRIMFDTHGPAEGSIEAPLAVLAERRAPNILLIPGTSSVAHLRENLAAAECALPDDAVNELDGAASIAAA